MFLEEYVEYISKEVIKRLWQDYSSARESRATKLVELADEFGPLEPTIKYYVEPSCQNINPAYYHEDEPDAVVRTPVFSFMNDFFNREFKITQDGRNQLLVLSDAGVGKTSLLLMIKLCELLPKLTPRIELTNDFRVSLLKIDNSVVGSINQIEEKSKTILLLDAFDEDPQSWQKPEKRLMKILQASSRFRRVIITCRTQFFPERGVSRYGESEKIDIAGYLCPIIFLSLFDRQQVELYLSKRFPSHGSESDDKVKIEKAKTILSKASTLTFRPFLLAHIEDLIESDCQTWNEYRIYDELVQIWLRREERKLARKDITRAKLWLACVIVAIKMKECGGRSLTKAEYSSVMKAMPVTAHLQYLDYGARSLLNRNSEGDFKFSHSTIQEFLIADFLIKSRDPGRMSGNLRFVIDRLSSKRKEVALTRKILEFVSASRRETRSSGNSDAGMSEVGASEAGAPTRRAQRISVRPTAPLALANVNLSGFVLRRENLQECDFRDADLRGVDFSGSNLMGADFTGANLSHSDLSRTWLDGASFVRAVLKDANLENSTAKEARFDQADFTRANLKGVENMKIPRARTSAKFKDTIMPDGKRTKEKRK